MRFDFRHCLMHGSERRAGEFELAAGLKRNRGASALVVKTDDVAFVVNRRPAEPLSQSFEKRADAALTGAARVRHGSVIGLIEGELLMLGADAELLGRLRAIFDPGDEFVARRDGGQIRNVARHKETFVRITIREWSDRQSDAGILVQGHA